MTWSDKTGLISYFKVLRNDNFKSSVCYLPMVEATLTEFHTISKTIQCTLCKNQAAKFSTVYVVFYSVLTVSGEFQYGCVAGAKFHHGWVAGARGRQDGGLNFKRETIGMH